jgi:hypothetical protein
VIKGCIQTPLDYFVTSKCPVVVGKPTGKEKRLGATSRLAALLHFQTCNKTSVSSILDPLPLAAPLRVEENISTLNREEDREGRA